MIKSIINIIIFIGIVSVFSFAVTQFAKTNDEFQIILSNIEITFSPIAVIIVGAIGLFIIWFMFKICNFLQSHLSLFCVNKMILRDDKSLKMSQTTK